jgi:hypothetical protein
MLIGRGPVNRDVRCKVLRVAKLSDTNPYSAPETVDGGTAGRPLRRSSLRYVRAVFYFHVLVVCWLAVFTLSDTGQIKVPDIVKMLFYFRPLQMPLVFTWMLCPPLMAVAAAKLTNRSTAFRAGLVVGDALLSVFQLWVMLPLVQ